MGKRYKTFLSCLLLFLVSVTFSFSFLPLAKKVSHLLVSKKVIATPLKEENPKNDEKKSETKKTASISFVEGYKTITPTPTPDEVRSSSQANSESTSLQNSTNSSSQNYETLSTTPTPEPTTDAPSSTITPEVTPTQSPTPTENTDTNSTDQSLIGAVTSVLTGLTQ